MKTPRRVYTGETAAARLVAWERDTVHGREVTVTPELGPVPGLSLTWDMSAADARELGALLVAAADAVDAGQTAGKGGAR